MKRVLALLIFALAALTAAPGSSGQAAGGKTISMEGSFLEPLNPRDSALIADQFRYGFHLKDVPKDARLGLPDISSGLQDSVEIVSPWLIDTVGVHGSRKNPQAFDIDVSLVVTSFEEGVRNLVPLSVTRAIAGASADTLVFNPQAIEFFTIPVDTAAFVIHDLKGPVKYPLTFAEIAPWILAVLAKALIVSLVVYLIRRRGKNRKEAEVAEPAHIRALRKLEEYRGSKFWAPERQKAYYSGITDTMREYIASRYGIDAKEMTTAEIFEELRHTDVPADQYTEMKALFERADFVKFAKAYATDEENAAALPAAVSFVTVTYRSLVESENAAAENEKPEEGGTD